MNLCKIAEDAAVYHNRPQVNSGLLKAALISPAHIAQVLNGTRKPSDAMTLGTAVHTWFLERDRFEAEYVTETDVYQRASGTYKAGDVKTDDEGNPMIKLISPDGEVVKGENYRKFAAMTAALDASAEAMKLLDGGITEQSFITDKERVRPDLITSDGWLVDLKTVGGTQEMPLTPENFAREFWARGYDLQMYMYDKVVQECGVERPQGFIFLCVDAKIPSGVRLFVFKRESDWWAYGEKRYNDAWTALSRYYETKDATKYPDSVVYDLPVPFAAVGELAK